MTTPWSVDTAPGPHAVRIDRGEWFDAVRARSVPYKIYRPEVLSEDKYPVVVWSHGLGGTRDGAGFLGRYLASHGYLHVHIQHDGTDDSLWRGMPGHPWDNIRNQTIPWETVRNRYLDVTFVVDQLALMNNADGLYEGKMDFTRLGMSGHSFGALTTQVMLGQLAGRETPEDLHDDRFLAGILYSPVPAFRHQMGGRDVYASINKPLLHMTGTEDASPIEGFGIERRLEVFECAGGGDQHVLILEGGDHMVFNGSRGQLESYDDIGVHQDIIALLARAWWETWLNNDADARAFLWGDGVARYLAANGTYRRR
jgi:dienelactone hydrolase